MNETAKLKSQVANLEAQNARIIKEKAVIQHGYEMTHASWLMSERHNEELEAEIATHKVLYMLNQPCKHPGCLHHVLHPCEHCGRTAGQGVVYVAVL